MSKRNKDSLHREENSFTRREFLTRFLALLATVTGATSAVVALAKISSERELRELPTSLHAAFLRKLFQHPAFSAPEEFGLTLVSRNPNTHPSYFTRNSEVIDSEPQYSYFLPKRLTDSFNNDSLFQQFNSEWGSLTIDLDSALLLFNRRVLEREKQQPDDVGTIAHLDNANFVRFVEQDADFARKQLSLKQSVQRQLTEYLTMILQDNPFAGQGIPNEAVQEALNQVQSDSFVENLTIQNSFVLLESYYEEHSAELYYSWAYTNGTVRFRLLPSSVSLLIRDVEIVDDRLDSAFVESELAQEVAVFRESLRQIVQQQLFAARD